MYSTFESLLAELAPTPARWRRAARVGLITALGAGVTAAMQIANPLGLTLLFNFALPEAAFSPARGAAFIAAAAVLQTLGLVVVGALVNSPIAHLTVFVLLCLSTTYLIYGVSALGRLWVWVQVPVVTAFYLAMFMPNEMGWNVAQAFGGMTIAVVWLLLCNAIVRPEPVDAILRSSIAAALARSRERLAEVISMRCGEAPAAQERPVASLLGHHLSLFESVLRSASSAAAPAALLADLTVAESFRGHVEKLAAAVHPHGGSQLPEATREELRALEAAVDRRLQRYIRSEAAAHALSAHAPAEGDGLAARSTRLEAESPEVASIALTIARLCELLETDPLELPGGSLSVDNASARVRQGTAGNFLVRFSTRHTLALTAAFLIGLWDNNPALHAAIWLLMLGGPPSHGATVRKFLMRAIGASGALALAALGTILIAPNFTSPASYMIAIFVGTMTTAYIGEGGGILSYLAIGGTAFVIGYGGPGPRADLLGSIWSIWGISLGMIIRAVVSMLWRERASRTLAEQFQAHLAAVLKLIAASGADPGAEPLRASAEMETIEGIAMMFTVANDALLEGRSAGIDAGQLVDALDTLRRLTFALGNLPRIAPDSSGEVAAVKEAVTVRFDSWFQNLREQTEVGVPSRAPLREMVTEAKVPELRLTAGDRNASSIEEPAAAANRRIAELMRTLERQLAELSL